MKIFVFALCVSLVLAHKFDRILSDASEKFMEDFTVIHEAFKDDTSVIAQGIQVVSIISNPNRSKV